MIDPVHDRAKLTWPQLLAAYADNELDESLRRHVEGRLAEDANAAGELEGQREFAPANEPFWQAVAPGEPSRRQWDNVRNRIEQSLYPVAGAASTAWQPRRNRWLRRGFLAALLAAVPVTAAAVALVLSLGSKPAPIGSPAPDRIEATDDVFTIVQPRDVEIVSVLHGDTGHLVVGEPPLNGNVTLASAADIQLDGLQPAGDGSLPELLMGGEGAPMIYSPLPRPK